IRGCWTIECSHSQASRSPPEHSGSPHMDPAAGLVTWVLLFDESEQLLDRGLAGAQQEVRLQRDQRRCRGHSGEMDRSGCIADEPGILARASLHVRWPIPPSEVLGGKRDVAQEVRIPGPDQI